MKRIVIAGIHTCVGKTVVAALFTQALDGSYWKPVQCGAPTDAEWVERFTGKICYPSRYVFKTPCSPHLAARIEKVRIDAKSLHLPEHSGPLIIEGTGGILAPLNETETWIDAAKEWNATWVLVHRHYLGSLNHFLLTIEALERREIPLHGIVFNGAGDLETEEMLFKKTNAPCLGRLPWQKHLNLKKMAIGWKIPLW